MKKIVRTSKGGSYVIQLHWKQIPRANNPQKPLQEKAVNILSTIVHQLRKSAVIILDHNNLTAITKCGKDQNVNLLKQLADILDISFHNKTIIDGKIYRNCYIIRHTLKGRSIIEDPKILLTQKHFIGSTAISPIEKTSPQKKLGSLRAKFLDNGKN